MFKNILVAAATSICLAGCASVDTELKQKISQGMTEMLVVALTAGHSGVGSQSSSQANSTSVDFTDFINCHIVEDTQKCSNSVHLGRYETGDTDKEWLNAMTAKQRASVIDIIEDDKTYIDQFTTDEPTYRLSIQLKNATAFGVPIQSIKTLHGYEFGYNKVIFKNASDLDKVSRFFSLTDFQKHDNPDYFLAVRHDGEFCDSRGKNCEYKEIITQPLYDRNGRRLPDLSDIIGGCYWGVIFNRHERSLSNEGGC